MHQGRPTRPGRPARPPVLGELLDPATYRAAGYVLLSVPVGGLIAALLTASVLGGLLTLPVLIGALFLVVALWLVGALGDLQRILAGLLGVRFVRPAPPLSTGGLLGWLGVTLADPATYRTLLFHVIQLPLGLVCWVVLATLLAVVVLGLGAPLWLMNSATPLVWNEWTLRPGPVAVAGLVVIGAGALQVTAGVLNLMGRMWTRLSAALLALDAGEAARREVIALRRAAGRVALGDDLHATLRDLTTQAREASTAEVVALVAPDGTLRAADLGFAASAELLSGPLTRPPAPGEASLTALSGGEALAALPVTLPASAGGDGGTLRALYAPGTRPGADELAFLLSIADHAGTALHAAQLIERAGARAGELERARLARELHDSVAQALYGITLGAKTARATLDRDPNRTRQSLEYTIRLAEGGVSEMKALLFSLRPDALEEGGLVAALTQHAHALEARHGLTVHAELSVEPDLSPDAQAAAYRVAQEALHNTVKHARAQHVWLSVTQDDQHVTLNVRDDGRGFDVSAQGRGTLGQRSMRERAAGAGGQLAVLSTAGEGTQVTLTLPRAALLPSPEVGA
ncbi:sensor histidine kinase [Deinococcus sedimenti]|uniref:Histidine kinase n=1 Tax=Deinococcus sedimenti TaxID=1867090 RepID=A0ABQ2RXQ2_9DEIO|nr:sensor histidine kinase [Deinococcus sedimenti]GGR78867.1 histidine kinase [Deinococcus sedimenti]